ncbi:beta-glucanase [Flavivirga aquatica]|uniref:Beta-glucanase n=1 Tax=Flavivirga aquatica TaxID=1849968 RepID=A0A1E5SIH4_9FLAO|nr:family 16 glycosylhydrolase [Flavivirga aquatica]OEJ98913.1 beta-glucanase [Flavivirga aquatica]
MKRDFINLFFVFLFVSQLSVSQEVSIDFSDSSDNFTAFLGSGFSFNKDPNDSGNDVGQFFNDGSNAWQGFSIDLIKPIDLDSQNILSLSFYGFDPNTHIVTLKLEDGENPNVQVTQNVPSGGGWIDHITFNFSNAVLSSDGVTPVNAAGTYGKLTIFIDGGVTTPGTYLIDNFRDGSAGTDPNAIDVEYTNLVWEDNFDIPEAVNPDNWHHQTQLPAGGSWFNGEEQHYTNRLENSFVDNGFLNIVAIKESFTYQGITKEYTSARLNSKFAFTYGRVDVRAKLPEGAGTWPAIWMLGKNIDENGGFWDSSFGTTNWPACGEIDIMEHGLGAVNHVSSALHTSCAGCFGNTMNTNSKEISDVVNNFHIYSVNWSPNQITFLIDGEVYYVYNPLVKDASTWPFDADQYILLNIAMGGIAGTIDSRFTKSAMVIDYVKVYQADVLSIEDSFSLNDAIRVYPNPTNDKVYVTTKVLLSSLALYDVFGKLILRKVKDTISIDLGSVNSGVYFLEVYSNNEKVVKKVIVN